LVNQYFIWLFLKKSLLSISLNLTMPMIIKQILSLRKEIGFFAGLLLFMIMLINPISQSNHTESLMAATAVLMVVWWISEAIPLGATSLVPIVIMPVLGIMSGNSVAREYFNSTILIFLGGFLIALAMQKWMLHKRISLVVIRILGSSTSGIVLGFMSASAILSMFISNVATTVMLLPIGLAFISRLEEEFGKEESQSFSVSIMLGIAYSSSIGGIATLIGTAPNLIFKRVYEMNFPDSPEITFASWLAFGLPIAFVMLILTWMVLSKFLFPASKSLYIDKTHIDEQLADLGKISFEEKTVLIIFMATVFLWLFRTNINLEFIVIPGWSELLPVKDMVDDGTIAIFSGLLLFILPASRSTEGSRKKIINIDILSKVPWEVILIFGGGFALAKGFTDSGLSDLIGQNFNNLNELPPTIMIASISTILTFLTELTSNTATTNAILPLLASVAKASNLHPLMLMLPATLSASFAFMLPVGTPPNAIVYGSGYIRIQDMVKAGFYLNITGIIVITIYFLIAIHLFGIV
jgi:sodium-dependent dicarboxylate transporter 2/3/5